MKLANLDDRPVLVDGDRVFPVPSTNGGDPVVAAITDWPGLVERALTASGPHVDPVDVRRLGPPVPRPGKIVGAPVNYRDHQKEMNASHTIAGLGFFLKSPTSIVGGNGHIELPFPGRRTDHEAELGVVIGRTATAVTAAAALDHVFGYTCLVDVTVRGDEERSTRKSFPGFTPIGPWITTADEVPDPTDLRIRGWVDGELRQDASTSEMVYGVAELIEFISSVITLHPGDIIATGTPAGVGPIVDGNTVTVEIDRVGRLELPVRAGSRAPHPMWLTRESP